MAGVDVANQFPKSRMAQAAKLGQSRFSSVDVPDKIQLPSQGNINISVATSLSVPQPSVNSPGDYMPTTYAVVSAVGGTLYATYDGSIPSSTNFAVAVAAGGSLPITGAKALSAIKVVGTMMSVSYWT